MAFDEVRLATKIELGAVGGPEFRTEVVVTGGGHESRNAAWTYPRGRWDIAPGIQGATDLRDAVAFFYARQGRARGFRFKDHTDFQVIDGVIIASAAGGETSAQAVKIYASGAVSFVRTLTKIVSGTFSAKKNGIAFGAATVNVNTGVISFPALTAGEQVTASFEFDVPVRFDTDHLPIRQVTHLRDQVQPIPIIEIRDIA